MTTSEQQEELEVLRSIFDGDPAFSAATDNSIQYRFGEENTSQSFLLEIRWPISYPTDAVPEFVLDLFYNKHVNAQTKDAILRCLTEEVDSLRGSAMTYSLIELLKDRFEQLMETQTQADSGDPGNRLDDGSSSASDNENSTGRKQAQGKSEKLTKAQKRKMWDRGQANDEGPRGWNWVDIVKHLSQTAPS